MFDKRGMLYALGTAFGTEEYANPVARGLVEVQFSKDSSNCHSKAMGYQVSGVQQQSAEAVVTHGGSTEQLTQFSRGAEGAWLVISLKGQLMVPSHYCYRGDSSGGESHPRTWELQGSADGVTWQMLRRHVNDSSVTRRCET